MRKLLYLTLVFMIFGNLQAQKQFELNETWIQKINEIAPSKSEVQAEKLHKVLVFNLITGYDHWVTPHTAAVIKVLGEKTGAYEVVMSTDIFQFEKKNLKKYDAIVLNNNCSVNPKRDMFWDELNKDENLSEDDKNNKAAKLEANLIEYVKKGGGLMLVHGGIVMQNNSMEFSQMAGGSFDYHPAQQEITLELVEPDHPLVKAFNGNPFVHVDEPYLFKNAYTKKDFRPLLYMETSKLKNKKAFVEEIKYVSWIKKHGKGRVFFVSPSHNAQSFEDVRLLKFFLDGAQYVLGDLKCDDTPLK